MKKILKPKSFLVLALALSFVWMRESFGETPQIDNTVSTTIEIVE